MLPVYDDLTDDELLNLAQQRDQLTDQARLALDTEIENRKLSPQEIRAYAQQTLAQERRQERKKQRSAFSYSSSNRKLIGKKNWKFDARKRIEEFDTTRWYVFVVPVYPIASYRVRRLYGNWWNPRRSTDVHILETRPRDWDQIRVTGLRYGLAVAVVFLTLLTLAWIRRR